jgi:dTDP-glucose 4,6-dehydratase
MQSVLITGGAGFIGQNLVRRWHATRAADRPGHDHRYAIDATKLAGELGNRCRVSFETGLRQTISLYLDREDWWREVTSGAYKAWIDKNCGFRMAV